MLVQTAFFFYLLSYIDIESFDLLIHDRGFVLQLGDLPIFVIDCLLEFGDLASHFGGHGALQIRNLSSVALNLLNLGSAFVLQCIDFVDLDSQSLIESLDLLAGNLEFTLIFCKFFVSIEKLIDSDSHAFIIL